MLGFGVAYIKDFAVFLFVSLVFAWKNYQGNQFQWLSIIVINSP